MGSMLKELREWMSKYKCHLTASVDLLDAKKLRIGIGRLDKETIVLDEVDIVETSPNNDDAIVCVLDIEKVEFGMGEK